VIAASDSHLVSSLRAHAVTATALRRCRTATAIPAAIGRVPATGLTACEQHLFVAIVVDGIPLDALAARLIVRPF
jgi:hypothetical protein